MFSVMLELLSVDTLPENQLAQEVRRFFWVLHAVFLPRVHVSVYFLYFRVPIRRFD